MTRRFFKRWNREEWLNSRQEKRCKSCGVKYLPNSPRQKYCVKGCSKRQLPDRHCVGCDSIFDPGHGRRIWCSEKCYELHHEDPGILEIKQKFTDYKKRAIKEDRSWELCYNDFTKLLRQGCYYCDGRGGGIDRVDNRLGYTLDNSVSCCRRCNMMKSDMSLKDFVYRCQQVAANSQKSLANDFFSVSPLESAILEN